MDLLLQNLISPIVLAFALGILARLVKSDLEIPDAIYQALSIYLLFAIGLKGGVAISETPASRLVAPIGITFVMGVLTATSAFFILKMLGRLNRIDAAASAAHYGSVSAVTFLAAIEAAKFAGYPPDGYLPALVAVLEVPGIIVGLLFARQQKSGGITAALREVLTGKSIFLLLGGMAIGAACGTEKIDTVAPFFIAPFKGALCIFLLELGIIAGGRLGDARNAGWRLIVAGCLLPLFHGVLGTIAGSLVGMSVGGASVFGAMVGSASYIAAPAAVRIALPKASPGIYLTLALGITFPFNLTVGIPLFLAVAKFFQNLPS